MFHAKLLGIFHRTKFEVLSYEWFNIYCHKI